MDMEYVYLPPSMHYPPLEPAELGISQLIPEFYSLRNISPKKRKGDNNTVSIDMNEENCAERKNKMKKLNNEQTPNISIFKTQARLRFGNQLKKRTLVE